MRKLVGNVVQQYQCDLVVAEFSEMGQYLYRNPYLSAVHKIVSCHRCLSDTFEKIYRNQRSPAIHSSKKCRSAETTSNV